MEKARRDNLRGVIARARTDLEESVRQSLAALGLFIDAEATPLDELNRDESQRELRARLEVAIARESRALGRDGVLIPEAVRRYVRESGGTWINRLAALRALEVRDLLSPRAAFVADEYASLSPRALRLQELDASLTPDRALQQGIVDACAELSVDVRVLFDTADDKTLLWPSHRVLRKVLRAFSEEVTEDDWRQDDVLGWVYQYYNTEANAELKRRKNKTQGYKYTADDIPIANQFYTPHWVVRVLTDNTLGRLWLESRERDPRMNAVTAEGAATTWSLDERRHPDVPRADADLDGFRAWIAEEPDPLRDPSVDRLCRYLVPLPSPPPTRAAKHPREIKVLDPACGSGHFLLYAFDVLFAIWREGASSMDPLEIPAAILEHNLHGLDIDLRAAQLAAFNLYLKARVTHRALARSLGRADARFAVRRMNIVVADAHLGDDPRKKAFLDRYRQQPDIQQLYAKVLDSIDHTNVLGGLLKVRTAFESLFRPARDAQNPERAATRRALARTQTVLPFAAGPQRELTDVFTAASGRQWTLHELLEELRAFERSALAEQDIGARLFFNDLGRTMGLLGLLMETYDVVLMNPPYGDMPEQAKVYCKGTKKQPGAYPRTHHDLYAVFLEQGLDLLSGGGMLGALVPWSYMFLSTFAPLRQEVFFNDGLPELLQVYGYGILDGATVGTTGTILRKCSASSARGDRHVTVFERLSEERLDVQKSARFVATLPESIRCGFDRECDWYVATLASLRDVPGMPYAYWASDGLRELFRKFPALDMDSAPEVNRPSVKHADVKFGLSTKDNPRFLRFFWEVRSDEIGREGAWCHIWKGGGDAWAYAPMPLVARWKDDGAELKEWASNVYGSKHWSRTIQGHQYFFRAGIAFNRLSWRTNPYSLLEAGSLFSDGGPAIFPADESRSWAVLAMLLSDLFGALKLMLNPERKFEIGAIASFPIVEDRSGDASLETAAKLVWGARRTAFENDEVCRDYRSPALRDLVLSALRLSDELRVENMLGLHTQSGQRRQSQIRAAVETINEAVYRAYGISIDDRALIASELARRPKAEGGSTEDAPSDDEDDTERDEEDAELSDESAALTAAQSRDLVSRWLSYYVKRCIEADHDGVVPLATANREKALIVRVREAMREDLGDEAAGQLEAQAPPYLGTDSVAAWLETSAEETLPDAAGKPVKEPRGFFPWHVRLYRNRPIFWMLSSEGFERGRTRYTFRVFVHALKVSADMLTKLREFYLLPELERVRNETSLAFMRAQAAQGAVRAATEREHQEWVNTVAAMEGFLRAVDATMKGPPKRATVAPNAKWLERTIAEVRGGQDVGHGWRPVVDHGVRVNIAALVENRLLPKVVLKKLGGK